MSSSKTMIIVVMMILMCCSSSAAGGSVIMFGDGTECTPESNVTGASTYHRDGIFGECVVNKCATGFTKKKGKCNANSSNSNANSSNSNANSSNSNGSDPEPCNVSDFPNATTVSKADSGCVIDTCATEFRLFNNTCARTKLVPGDVLKSGEFIVSDDGKYKFLFKNGELFIYDTTPQTDDKAVWTKSLPRGVGSVNGGTFKIEEKGVKVYKENNEMLYGVTSSNPLEYVKLNNDGILVMKDKTFGSISNLFFDQPPSP